MFDKVSTTGFFAGMVLIYHYYLDGELRFFQQFTKALGTGSIAHD